MSNIEPIEERNSDGKIVYRKYIDGWERWWEWHPNGTIKSSRNSDGYKSLYDSNGNEIYYCNGDGYEEWLEYDANNNCIHYRDTDGVDKWYDSDGNEIDRPR